MLAWFTSRLVWAGGLLLAVLGAVAAIWSRGRAAGAAGERLKQAEAKDKLQKEYDRIGAEPKTFDDAIADLRRRGGL